MIAAVKMGEKFYAKSFDDVSDASDWAQEHVDSGGTVLMTDDIEYLKAFSGFEVIVAD